MEVIDSYFNAEYLNIIDNLMNTNLENNVCKVETDGRIETSRIEQLQEMGNWEKKHLDDIKEEFGYLPPPWIEFPYYHPYSMGWRMGVGETYMYDVWRSWWDEQELTLIQKIEYFRKYENPPAYLKSIIYYLYGDELYTEPYREITDEEYKPYFAKIEALGFGSYEDWKEDIESDRWEN